MRCPANWSVPPEITSLLVSRSKEARAPGSWVDVLLEVKGKEGDALKIRFYYNQRVGDRANRNAVRPLKWKKAGAK